MSFLSKFSSLLILSIIPLIGFSREYTSADGSKRIVADFISYDTGQDTVTLRLSTGQKIEAAADAFSEGDQRYFKARDKREALKEAFDVGIVRKTERDTNSTSGSIEYEYKNFSYDFVLQNTSHLSLKNLNFKYWIIIDRDNKGKGKTETIEQRKAIASLNSNEKVTIEGPSVRLIQKATSLSCSTCPKVRAQMADRASEIGRDRIVGTAVEVSDHTGKVLFRHSDSKSVLSQISGKRGVRKEIQSSTRVKTTGDLQGLDAPSIADLFD